MQANGTYCISVKCPNKYINSQEATIEEVTTARRRPARVTHLIYSHSHADHIGAAAIIGGNVTRIAHAQTKRLLRTSRDTNRPLPTVTFEDQYELRVGGEQGSRITLVDAIV